MCICNLVWESDVVPNDWKNGTTVYIPNKGNLSNLDNWRGVTLLSTPGKVYCQLILNHMCDMADAHSVGSSQVIINRTEFDFMVQHSHEYHVSLAVSFIDFNKAFDSIHTNALKDTCIIWVLTKLVSTTEKNYNNLSFCIWTEDRYSSWFQVLTSVW